MGDRTRHRRTRQREAVLEVLRRFQESGVHPTADEVYIEVRRLMPRTSLATVYRNLDLLASMGVIQRLGVGCSPVRFDGNASDHLHVRCVRCGRAEDLPETTVTAHGESGASLGYEVLGLKAEFIGLCPRCRLHTPTPPAH